jgi:uncharacterized protein YfaS (alpha-2-macroglobulin family)
VNLDQVELTLRKVSDRNLQRVLQDGYFGRPLAYWQEQAFDRDIAETVWVGEGDVQNALNRDMTTRLPVGDIISALEPGVYAMTAAIPGADPYDETDSTQWFVLSDLGVTSLMGEDGLHVFVRGLGDAKARSDVSVTLLSRSNRVLTTATTDAEGYARFQAGMTRGKGATAPALLLFEHGDDFAFLSLTDPAFDLSDRGVEGRPPSPPLDLFVTTDRGAYRAGETIYATTLMRGNEVEAISGLPLTAIVTRPDGVEYSRHVITEDQAGGRVFEIPISATAPRGAWSLDFKSDLDAPALARKTVLVEDFLPERIDFDMSFEEAALSVGQTSTLNLSARYLFGAPGANLPVQGEITLRPQSTLEAYPGYMFGRYDDRIGPRTSAFGEVHTDTEGTALIPLSIPALPDVAQPLLAEITARVSEGSGRPVERHITQTVAPQSDMIGIRPVFDGVVPEGTQAEFEVIALNANLEPTELAVRWTLNRVETRYQWYQLYGNWEWEPTTSRTRVASGEASVGEHPLSIVSPVEWGRYELVVETTSGRYIAAAIDFHAGWYAPADVSATPDTLEMSLDQDRYLAGDTAQLRIVPRAAGTALISVMSNRLIAIQAVEVTEGENLIPLPVTDDWGAGAYVTASLIRPMDVAAGLNPSRALGLSYAQIDPDDKRLDVSLSAPVQIEPGSGLEVGIEVDGLGTGQTGFVTLAAVDVGILNLTAFKSPDPNGHYFGQRKLGVEIRDIYGRLIDGLNGEMGAMRSGGDASSRMQLQSPPPTEDLVAFFSGPLALDETGKASAHFDLPEFNGTVRLMAVAWSPTAVGQAEQDVLVRNPIVMTASLPRFMSPGDVSRLRLDLTHTEGPVGKVALEIEAPGLTIDLEPVASQISIAQSETLSIDLPVEADAVGDHEINLTLTTPDGKSIAKSLTLPVRRNDPAVSTTQRFALGAGDAFELNDEIFADLRLDGATALMSAGAFGKFDVPGILQSLDRYPYGCTEQVTSRALPMLYFKPLAGVLGLSSDGRVDQFVAQSITQVLTRQSANGAFGLWRPASGDFWLDAYVTDFLSRAHSEGYDVPQLALRQALDNLRNRINYAPDFEKGGQDIAYALMVLAREGAAAMGDLRYYADVKAEAFDTPLAAAQLGAALAQYGDQTRSDRLFRQAARLLERRMQDETTPVWRVDYGSNLRDAAGLLALATEAGSLAVDSAELSKQISQHGRTLSTQESAWALMAAHALIDEPGASPIQVNGAPVAGNYIHRHARSDAPAIVTNASSQPVDLTITTTGVPTYSIEQGGYGYALHRSYFNMDGTPHDPQNARVGERFVTVLKVTPFEPVGARLMINDPLPAGFEIDNPNLLRSGDIREMPWLTLSEATHSEFRSDRFLAAMDWRSDQPFQLAYVVRAVSPGAFHHPAASVEDMYRPQYRAWTPSNTVVIDE